MTADVQALTKDVRNLTPARRSEVEQQESREAIKSVITEMCEGFNNLMVTNEVTRKLAEDIARLAIQTSQRVTVIESSLE